MATPEPLEPSRRLSQAALAERERLQRRAEKLEANAKTLREQVRRIDAAREELAKRLALIDELVPVVNDHHLQVLAASVAEPRPPRGYLRGAEIRRVAVQMLAASRRPVTAIHYTDWLERVREAGYEISGRDPAATFLTQINRSALIVRTDEPGTYALDLEAPARLRQRLQELHDELLALHHGQQTLEAVISTRERRDELVLEITRTQRRLEEALAVLEGDYGDSG